MDDDNLALTVPINSKVLASELMLIKEDIADNSKDFSSPDEVSNYFVVQKLFNFYIDQKLNSDNSNNGTNGVETDSEWLTVKEASEMLGLGERWVRELATDKRQLTFRRRGDPKRGRIEILRNDVEKRRKAKIKLFETNI